MSDMKFMLRELLCLCCLNVYIMLHNLGEKIFIFILADIPNVLPNSSILLKHYRNFGLDFIL